MKVVVTGASRGIGRGIATFLAADGFEVGILARSVEGLEDVRESIREGGGVCEAVACDLANPADTQKAIDGLAERLGGLDALVNNAGTVIRKGILDLSLSDWNRMVDVNIHGLFHATRAALPHFMKRGQGHIINISSISGKLPLAGGSGYAATKFACTGFSQSIFHELRDHHIKVTTVYPGSVDTASPRNDPKVDCAWKVTPEEIGKVCGDVLKTAPGTCIHEVEVRPLLKPSK